MAITADEILNAVRAWPQRERLQLAERIMDEAGERGSMKLLSDDGFNGEERARLLASLEQGMAESLRGEYLDAEEELLNRS